MTTPRKRGRPRQMAPGRLELRIDPALHAEVAAAAKRAGQDVSAYTRGALEQRMGAQEAELAAWREGREAGRREAIAAVTRIPTLEVEPNGRWHARVGDVSFADAYGGTPEEAAARAARMAATELERAAAFSAAPLPPVVHVRKT